MSEKARALGIPEKDILRALILIRDFRRQAHLEKLDPRATRIAIVYVNLVDQHFARQKLDLETLAKLEEIARDLHQEQR